MNKHLDLHGLTESEAREKLEHALGQGHSGDTLEIIHGYGSSGSGGILREMVLDVITAWEGYGRIERNHFRPTNPGSTKVWFI